MSYSIHIPTSLEEAYRIRKETDGKYLAGGTTLFVLKKRPNAFISLERIPGLSYIDDKEGLIEIGGCTTFDDMDRCSMLKQRCRALWVSAHEMAGPQIRNRATIGGNIGGKSPSADSVTAMMALNARIRLFSMDGEKVVRREVPIRGLAMEEGEIIESIIIPDCKASVFEKIGKRNAMAVSLVNMAVAEDESGISVAVGCAAPQVLYCSKTSRVLTEDPNAMVAAKEAILEEISPKDDRWGTVEQKRIVCCNLLEKLVREVHG